MTINWVVDRRGAAGPVINQGPRPTCLSCATSSAHGSASGESRSIEFLHYASRRRPNGVGTFPAVRDVLATDGQPPEAQWPYDATTDDALAAPPAEVIGPFVTADLDASVNVDGTYLTGKLQDGSLPIIGLRTTRRLMVLKNAILVEPDVHLGRHAVLLVGVAIYRGADLYGLTDGDALMCIQNSWGTGWGTRGYGMIGPRAWTDMALLSAVLTGA